VANAGHEPFAAPMRRPIVCGTVVRPKKKNDKNQNPWRYFNLRYHGGSPRVCGCIEIGNIIMFVQRYI
jgi:hypothetical protein